MVQASVIGSFAVVITLVILSRGTPANALQEEAADSCSTPDCQAPSLSVPLKDDVSLLSLKAKVRTNRTRLQNEVEDCDWNSIFLAKCTDTTDGAKNSAGDGCDYYTDSPSSCSDYYDTEDFDAVAMCCACGGGQKGTTETCAYDANGNEKTESCLKKCCKSVPILPDRKEMRGNVLTWGQNCNAFDCFSSLTGNDPDWWSDGFWAGACTDESNMQFGGASRPSRSLANGEPPRDWITAIHLPESIKATYGGHACVPTAVGVCINTNNRATDMDRGEDCLAGGGHVPFKCITPSMCPVGHVCDTDNGLCKVSQVFMTWQLVHSNTACSDVIFLQAAASVADCQATAELDSRCGNQIHSAKSSIGYTCACVPVGETCKTKTASTYSVYESSADNTDAVKYVDGGQRYPYNSRDSATSACKSLGYPGLCAKSDIEGFERCAYGWMSDFNGYWMNRAASGCGNRKGYHGSAGRRSKSGAYCCRNPTIPSLPRVQYVDGGSRYPYSNRDSAKYACESLPTGYGLCAKADIDGFSRCAYGWMSDFNGYWMNRAASGCGNRKGYHGSAGGSNKAGAYCCKTSNEMKAQCIHQEGLGDSHYEAANDLNKHLTLGGFDEGTALRTATGTYTVEISVKCKTHPGKLSMDIVSKENTRHISKFNIITNGEEKDMDVSNGPFQYTYQLSDVATREIDFVKVEIVVDNEHPWVSFTMAILNINVWFAACMGTKECVDLMSPTLLADNCAQLSCLQGNNNADSSCLAWRQCVQQHGNTIDVLTALAQLACPGNSFSALQQSRHQLTTDAPGCLNPVIADIESWDCACGQELLAACPGLAPTCVKDAACDVDFVCCSWKANNGCPCGAALMEKANTSSPEEYKDPILIEQTSMTNRGGKHSRISNDIDASLEDTLNRKNCVR